MNGMDDDLLQDYLAECREHLADIEGDLLAIEERGADIDEEQVNKTFRAAHSIKGGAGFFNLSHIRELAHKIENLLEMVRSRQTVPTPEVVSGLLAAFDVLRGMVDDPAGSQQLDIAPSVASLEQLATSRMPEPSRENISRKVTVAAGQSAGMTFTVFDFDAAGKSGKKVYLIQCDLIHDVQRKGKNPLQVLRHLMGYGMLLESMMDLGSAGTLEGEISNQVFLYLLYATAFDRDMIAGIVDVPAARIWTVNREGLTQPIGAAPLAAEPAPVPEAAPPEPELKTPEPGVTAAVGGGAGADATVRLPVALLDALMNLAGELVLGRNQLTDAIARQDHAMVLAASQRISLITGDVQEAVMRTRMQPVGNLFQKFPRLVRDTARSLGKQVKLVTEGAEVELDKTIIEGLSDPLTHMVRNAVDHGIESPAERVRHGKPAEGNLFLRAWHEAGQVVVEVSDDGKGLDGEKIAASAVGKGAISGDAVRGMSEADKLALVFLPGVSTASTVSDLSGRGVGMDVVKTNLVRLGGKIEIRSELGKGAGFRIKLPLTLAIIPSLVVSVGEERLAIPQANVQALIRIPAAEAAHKIDRVGKSPVLMLRDGLIPLVYLDEVLHDADEAGRETGEAINVVLVSGGGFRYALVVERLHTTVEIVVKPLGRHLKHLAEYAGATILGDGCVALIVDVAGLAAVAGLETRINAEAPAEEAAAGNVEMHRLLLFGNSAEEPCAVPLDLVSRVEKIAPEQVEMVGGRRSMQYRGRSLPLVTLADAARVSALQLNQDAIAVVLTMGGREIGLLGTRPVDVVETDAEIDPFTLRQPGVAGSAIVRGRTTLVLDTFELADHAWPGWNASQETSQQQEHQPKIGPETTVLVAEDSAFFRTQVVAMVESAGCRVLSAQDGQAAWELLEERGSEIALVVTDVEMPRLDGLGLTRRIRADGKLAHLPVLMLTSLAGEDDLKRGYEAGATAYSVKIDRDELVRAIGQLLSAPNLAQLASHVATQDSYTFEGAAK